MGQPADLEGRISSQTVKCGWVESASIKRSAVSSDELIVENRLAADQLRSALHPAAMEHQPANIQEESEQQAEN